MGGGSPVRPTTGAPPLRGGKDETSDGIARHLENFNQQTYCRVVWPHSRLETKQHDQGSRSHLRNGRFGHIVLILPTDVFQDTVPKIPESQTCWTPLRIVVEQRVGCAIADHRLTLSRPGGAPQTALGLVYLCR